VKIPGIKAVKNLSRWIQARILGGALILGYHRVANVTSDEYDVCVTPHHFADHMEVLKRHAHPIRLTELVECLKSGSLPPQTVAVTFDDGYADNLFEGKPVLEKYGIPATVFVCTGYKGREFWWDELERLVMSSKVDLGTFSLAVEKNRFIWEPPGPSLEADVTRKGSIRRKFHLALYHFLLGLDVGSLHEAMEIIRNWSGISPNQASSARSMTREELSQLADGGLVELGAHTRHHPMLPQLSLAQQREEIVSSKHELEEVLGGKVDGFAYPNGRATHDTKKIVHEAGFDYACTSMHDVVRRGSDLHELTRFWQKDVDGEKFLQGLHFWMKGNRL